MNTNKTLRTRKQILNNVNAIISSYKNYDEEQVPYVIGFQSESKNFFNIISNTKVNIVCQCVIETILEKNPELFVTYSHIVNDKVAIELGFYSKKVLQ